MQFSLDDGRFPLYSYAPSGTWGLSFISNLKEESLRAPWGGNLFRGATNEKLFAWCLVGGGHLGACFQRSAENGGTGSNRYRDRNGYGFQRCSGGRRGCQRQVRRTRNRVFRDDQ